MRMQPLDGLVGQRIKDVSIESDEELRIATDKGVWILCAYGDCCSESWFDRQHLEGVDQVVGQVVTGVADRTPIGDPNDGRTRQEVDQIYSTEISTAKGACVFEMRNSSNGYYGGYYGVTFKPYRFEWEAN